MYTREETQKRGREGSERMRCDEKRAYAFRRKYDSYDTANYAGTFVRRDILVASFKQTSASRCISTTYMYIYT